MKKILNIVLACSAAFASCNDWLDLEPENAVTAEKYWKTEDQVSSAMSGIYCQWRSSFKDIWFQSEMRGDMLVPFNNPRADYLSVRQGNINSNNSYVKWEAYYAIINQCNLLLERSKIALEYDKSYTKKQDNIYKAQARVIRDLMYFYLIRIWKDVPYVLDAYYDDQTNRNVGVTDRMEILDDLIADLESLQQEGDLPYSYSASSQDKALNKGQITMYMLKALLADMYRMKGSYETNLSASQQAYHKCLDLCNTIIGSGQFALIPFKKSTSVEAGVEMKDLTTKADSSFYYLLDVTPNEWFDGLYVSGNSSESIMELQEDNYNTSGFYDLLVSSKHSINPNMAFLTSALFLPTEKELASACRYMDVRELMCYGVVNGAYSIWKYAGLDFESQACLANTDYKKNILQYRLAEIYLMKAEVLTQIAMANNNDQEMLLEAYRAVFKVRDRASAVEATDLQLSRGEYMQDAYWDELRADLPITLNPGDISASQMEKFILDEEARELAFEGRRWFDVLRNAERNAEGQGSCTGGSLSYLLNIAGSCTEESKVAYITGQFRKPDFRYLPYPYQDVSLNPNLKQKPFWGNE